MNSKDIKVRIQVVNIKKYMKLLSKAQKEAEQLNKTIAQLNNLKLGVDAIFIKNPRVELRIDGKKVN